MPHGLLNALSRRERDEARAARGGEGLAVRQDVTKNRILVLVFDFQFSTVECQVQKSSRLAGDSSSINIWYHFHTENL
jgi:formylmethanofuran dehydrogenase subunit E-like metal-binding protein